MGRPFFVLVGCIVVVGFLLWGLHWVAAYWFVVFSGHNEPMLCGESVGCFRLS